MRCFRVPCEVIICFAYILVSFAWVYFSESLPPSSAGEPERWAGGYLYREGLHIIVPALLLFLVLRWSFTRVRAVQSSLFASESTLSEAQRVAQVGSWVHDFESDRLEWSAESYRIFGFDAETFSPTLEGFLDAVHPDDREMVLKAYAESVETRKPYHIVHRILRRDGEVRYVREHCKAYYAGKGGAVRSIGTVQDITQQRQAENELLQAKRQLQYIIDNTCDVIFQIDLEGNYIYCNAAAEKMTGYSQEELLQMNILQLILPEYHPWVSELLRKRIAGVPDERSYTFEIQHKDGSRIWLELESSGVFDAEGKLEAVQGVVRDITDRKRMSDALEKRVVALTRPLGDADNVEFEDLFSLSEIQLLQDQIAEAIGVSSIIVRPDGEPITKPSNFTRLCADVILNAKNSCSRCFQRDAAYSRYYPEGLFSRPCLSSGLWHAGACITVGGHHVANWLVGQVRNKAKSEDEIRVHAREIGVDEQVFLEAFEAVPAMSKERLDSIVRVLSTLANRLSTSAYMNIQQARFIAEEKKRIRDLDLLSTAIGQSNETVVVTDSKGAIEYVNPAFEAITGYSCEEVIGKNPKILKSGLHSEEVYAEMWSRISSGEVWSGVLKNKRKDGSIYTEDAAISPVRNASGDIVNYVGVKRDITKELHLKEQINHAQKLEAVGRLAGGVAHDFNNFLQTILGATGILLGEMEEGTSQHGDVEEIRKATLRAAGLTRQLLEFGQNREVEYVALDINGVVRQSERMTRLLIGKKIELVFDLDDSLGSVLGDSGQIEQVLLNLVINARDAMPDGGKLCVSTRNVVAEKDVSAGVADKYVCLSVSDTGDGISEDVKKHLFEPFFTTKEVGKGTGLGLSVVYGIVEQHGGWIEVFSSEGEGSVFKSLFLVHG
ncbi:MAG: PAS domain S-box protein [Verrucomicrobiota bacterium]